MCVCMCVRVQYVHNPNMKWWEVSGSEKLYEYLFYWTIHLELLQWTVSCYIYFMNKKVKNSVLTVVRLKTRTSIAVYRYFCRFVYILTSVFLANELSSFIVLWVTCSVLLRTQVVEPLWSIQTKQHLPIPDDVTQRKQTQKY